MKTEPFLITLAVSSCLIILGSITIVVLQSTLKVTIERLGPVWTLVIKLIYLMFFLVMAFSLVPVVLHFFFSVQIKIGNGDLVLIRWLAANEPLVVYSVWGMLVSGLVIALPAVVKGGLLK